MSRLLRSRAWSVLALIAGVTSVWVGDVLWLRLAVRCRIGYRDRAAAGAARAQHSQAHAGDILDSVERRHHAVRWSCLLVSGELPRLPVLVVAGLVVALDWAVVVSLRPQGR